MSDTCHVSIRRNITFFPIDFILYIKLKKDKSLRCVCVCVCVCVCEPSVHVYLLCVFSRVLENDKGGHNLIDKKYQKYAMFFKIQK